MRTNALTMTHPNRDANSDDPQHHPFDVNDRSVANLLQISEWLRWRMTDRSLPPAELLLMELEVREVDALANLQDAVDKAKGDDLEAKMAVPEQRDKLKALSIQWLEAQRRLIDGTTAALTRKSQTNGH